MKEIAGKLRQRSVLNGSTWWWWQAAALKVHYTSKLQVCSAACWRCWMNWEGSKWSLLTMSIDLFRLWKNEFDQCKHQSGNQSSMVFFQDHRLPSVKRAREQVRPCYSVVVHPKPNFLVKFWEKSPFKKYTAVFVTPTSLPENVPVDLMAAAARIASSGNFNEVQHCLAQRGFPWIWLPNAQDFDSTTSLTADSGIEVIFFLPEN